MSSPKLSKAPLVEAILEIRWKLKEEAPGISRDPRYKLFVGRLFDRLEKDYPEHEALPTSSMPDEMLSYVAQHRFHTKGKTWPLVQTGPGIVTLNQTEEYSWDDFEMRSLQLSKALFAAYPDAPESLNVSRLQLRYVDAIAFDFESDNILAFMKQKLKIGISFPEAIFEKTPVNRAPISISTVFTFPVTNPKGALNLRFRRGNRKSQDLLVWETIVQSEDSDVPQMPDAFADWLKAAHALTHDLFSKLIAGELEESFQ